MLFVVLEDLLVSQPGCTMSPDFQLLKLRTGTATECCKGRHPLDPCWPSLECFPMQQQQEASTPPKAALGQ